VVVLLDLLFLGRFGTALGFTLFAIGLKRCNLLVDTCNVLFDDERKLLNGYLREMNNKAGATYADLNGPVIEQRFTFRHY
jgi:hypothetical protein